MSLVNRRICAFTLVCLCAVGSGCTPSDIETPDLAPSSSAQAAMTDYDKNGNEKLEPAELAEVPGLQAMLKKADKDQDEAISQGELQERFAQYSSDGIALMPFNLQVLVDGNPLAEAEVTLRPEKVLGDSYKPVKGITNEAGLVAFHVEGNKLPGIHAGIYRVEISKRNEQGHELIPSRYNTATTLGQEVAIDVEGIDHAVILKLSSRK